MITRTRFDEHAEAALHLDQVLIDQLLIGLQHSKRIDPEFGCDSTHRWQRIAFVEHAIEDHMHATIAKLAIDWLSIIPFTIHSQWFTSLVRPTLRIVSAEHRSVTKTY